MDARRRFQLEARARVIKAMAHPTRLFIIEEIARQERSVQELTGMIGADVSTVSKHLALLRQAGIVGVDRRGAMAFYRLRVPCVLGFFSCVESVLESVALEQRRALARDEA